MAAISFTRSTSDPTVPPIYDPREDDGISFHYNSTDSLIWIGLDKTGSATWGTVDYTQPTVADEGDPFVYTVYPPIVTTSTLQPDFAPQVIPAEGRMHFHISYFEDNTYSMFVGTSISPGVWERYDLLLTI